MKGRLGQVATSFTVIVVVELIVRAALNANRTGRFEALLKATDLIQALIVAAVLSVIFSGTKGRRA